MKKYVINLKRRPDRKQFFTRKNPHLNEVFFIDAVDGHEIDHDTLIRSGFDTNRLWRDPFRNRKLTHGEIGCFLSHAKAWEVCRNLNEPIIVFEDDVICCVLDEDYLISLTSDHQLIYLGRNENEPDKVVSIDDKLEIPAYPYNAHAYVITPKGANLLLNSGILQQIIPVDEYLPIAIPKLNAIAFKEDLAIQESRLNLGTDIEPNLEENWFIDFKVHPITVGTDRKKCVQLNSSAMNHNVYPKNLGVNVDWKGTDMSSLGGGMKINLLRDYIKDLPDHDVILFTDAYDVMYDRDLETITRRFIGFKTKSLFSAETSCWPDESLKDEYPESETPYRFLNSGTFITEVGQLKSLLQDPIEDYEDDQLYYTRKFLSNEFDMKLDYEGYIFQTNEPQVQVQNESIYNPRTRVFSCIYHGNGGNVEKNKFDSLYNILYPKSPDLFIPCYDNFDILEKDMIVINFMTQSQCEDLIDLADKHGGWEPHPDDKFPAQEIRLKELGLWEECETHWKKHIFPSVERYWSPMKMYGLREAFVMRYALDTQVSLSNHCDASMVTGSVKLNDDYEGANLYYHRQNVTNKDVPVGRCILFPGQVTHGHECQELKSGVKYSLTMWTQRYNGDLL